MVDKNINIGLGENIQIKYEKKVVDKETLDDSEKVSINKNPSGLNEKYISKRKYVFIPEQVDRYTLTTDDGQQILVEVNTETDRYNAIKSVNAYYEPNPNGYFEDKTADPSPYPNNISSRTYSESVDINYRKNQIGNSPTMSISPGINPASELPQNSFIIGGLVKVNPNTGSGIIINSNGPSGDTRSFGIVADSVEFFASENRWYGLKGETPNQEGGTPDIIKDLSVPETAIIYISMQFNSGVTKVKSWIKSSSNSGWSSKEIEVSYIPTNLRLSIGSSSESAEYFDVSDLFISKDTKKIPTEAENYLEKKL